MRLIALLPFFFWGAVQAQCTKDTDCKGDRVCEKGVCMAPTAMTSVAKALTAPLPASNAAPSEGADPIGLALQDQLKCASNPEPGKALRALRSRGYIGLKPKTAIDGRMVFEVTKPVTVFGYKVLEVTGWAESSDKTLFWRGPGTAPPLNIQVIVEGEAKAVGGDIAKRIGKGPSVAKATYSAYAHPAAEITCYGH